MKAILRQSKLVKHSQRYFTIGLIGTCEDRNSSYLQGPALAPDLIQRTLRCDSSNNYSELGLDVLSKVCNYENIHPPTSNSLETAVLLEQPFRRMRAAGQTPLVLGGDHSITFPVIKALHAVYASSSSHQREAQQDQQDTAHPPTPPAPAQQVGSAQAPADSPLDDLVIVHFDAHPDIYPNFENNLSSHASPFARILEAKLACRLISVGIRTANPVQREQLVKFPITWVEAKHFPVKGGELRGVLEEHIGKETKVYLSIDLDVLEPVSCLCVHCVCLNPLLACVFPAGDSPPLHSSHPTFVVVDVFTAHLSRTSINSVWSLCVGLAVLCCAIPHTCPPFPISSFSDRLIGTCTWCLSSGSWWSDCATAD